MVRQRQVGEHCMPGHVTIPATHDGSVCMQMSIRSSLFSRILFSCGNYFWSTAFMPVCIAFVVVASSGHLVAFPSDARPSVSEQTHQLFLYAIVTF